MSVQEREAIEAKAKSCGMSLSDYIRYAALAEEEPVHPGAVATAAAIRVSLGFRCPIQGCGFACASSAARCPAHGRQVVHA